MRLYRFKLDFVFNTAGTPTILLIIGGCKYRELILIVKKCRNVCVFAI